MRKLRHWKLRNSPSQEVAELEFSESRVHMQRRGRRGLFRAFQKGLQDSHMAGENRDQGFRCLRGKCLQGPVTNNI